MTTQQLRRQTKLRGIPISYKRKYFTSAKNLNSIYTHDRNMKKKTSNKHKHVYAKTNPTKIINTTRTCNLQKSFLTSSPHIKTTKMNRNLPLSHPLHPNLQNLQLIFRQIPISLIGNLNIIQNNQTNHKLPPAKQPKKPLNNQERKKP